MGTSFCPFGRNTDTPATALGHYATRPTPEGVKPTRDLPGFIYTAPFPK